MLKYIYLLLLLILLTSCEDNIQYTGATKLVFEGRVEDASGHALAGVFVSTSIQKEVSAGWFSFSADKKEDLISYTTTDENGYYRMIFPRPQNEDNILLLINVPQSGYPHNMQYSNATITNITQRDLDNYKIDFGTIALGSISNITKLTVTLPLMYIGSQNIVMAQGIVADNVTYYTLPMDETQLYYGALPYIQEQTASYNYTYTFTVGSNQQIVFKYGHLGDTLLNEVTIPIGSQDVNYIIE